MMITDDVMITALCLTRHCQLLLEAGRGRVLATGWCQAPEAGLSGRAWVTSSGHQALHYGMSGPHH